MYLKKAYPFHDKKFTISKMIKVIVSLRDFFFKGGPFIGRNLANEYKIGKVINYSNISFS